MSQELAGVHRAPKHSPVMELCSSRQETQGFLWHLQGKCVWLSRLTEILPPQETQSCSGQGQCGSIAFLWGFTVCFHSSHCFGARICEIQNIYLNAASLILNLTPQSKQLTPQSAHILLVLCFSTSLLPGLMATSCVWTMNCQRGQNRVAEMSWGPPSSLSRTFSLTVPLQFPSAIGSLLTSIGWRLQV